MVHIRSLADLDVHAAQRAHGDVDGVSAQTRIRRLSGRQAGWCGSAPALLGSLTRVGSGAAPLAGMR